MKELLKKKRNVKEKRSEKVVNFGFLQTSKQPYHQQSAFAMTHPIFYSTEFFSAFIRMLKRLLKRQMITPNLKVFRDFPPC